MAGIQRSTLKSAYCLHYNGKNKPWDGDSALQPMFAQPWADSSQYIPSPGQVLGKNQKYKVTGYTKPKHHTKR